MVSLRCSAIALSALIWFQRSPLLAYAQGVPGGSVASAAASATAATTDFPACSTAEFLYDFCSSATPSFGSLAPSDQAPCLCYSSTAWSPNGLDVPYSNCVASLNSAGSTDTSDLADLSSNLGFCASVGNVLNAATTVGGAPAQVTGTGSGVGSTQSAVAASPSPTGSRTPVSTGTGTSTASESRLSAASGSVSGSTSGTASGAASGGLASGLASLSASESATRSTSGGLASVSASRVASGSAAGGSGPASTPTQNPNTAGRGAGKGGLIGLMAGVGIVAFTWLLSLL